MGHGIISSAPLKMRSTLPAVLKTIYSARPENPNKNPYSSLTEFTVPKQDIVTYKTPDNLVTLNSQELKLAADVGIARQILFLNPENKSPYNGPGWAMSIAAACGELAVAKYFDIYYKPNISMKNADYMVGKVNVRVSLMTTPTLVIRQLDLANKNPFILVAGTDEPNYYLVGWTEVKDALKEQYVKQTPGKPSVYMIPYFDLNPIDTIPDEYLDEEGKLTD